MRKLLFLFVLHWLVLVSNAQQAKPDSFSLPDSIRKFFNYDTLKYISCIKTPPGVYALYFKIGTDGIASDYEFSQDSLTVLKNLLISAVGKALKAYPLPIIKDKRCLQLIYYNNFLGCLDTTALTNESNIQKQISDLLENQLFMIEKSINDLAKRDFLSEYVFLRAVIINNKNPNQPTPGKSFINDNYKTTEKERPIKNIEEIKKEIERKKREKGG